MVFYETDKLKQLLNLFLWPLLWLLNGLTFSWLLLSLFFEDRIYAVRVVGYFQQFLLPVLIFGAVTAVIGRRRYLALCLGCLAVILGVPSLPYFLPRLEAAPTIGRNLSVMSYSVNGWNKDLAAVTAVIRKNRADIILEQGAPLPEEISDRVEGIYDNGKANVLLQARTGVISRFPVTALGSISGAYKARIELPEGQAITVWIVHTSKEPHGYFNQVREVEGIVADVKATPGPKIVAGDFNTTPGTVPYRILARALKNAHQEAGWGFGFTYPTPARRLGRITSFLRIDHIWYSDEFYALKARTLDDHGGSDHRPVTAELGVVAASQR